MSNSAKLRILLAEDHALVREGLKRLVNEQRDMEVVDEAGDGREALRLAVESAPDIVLLDVSLPVWDGVRTAQMLRASCPDVKIIAVTRHDDQGFVAKMLEAGASGYVLKQSLLTELTRAIRAVARGEQHIDPSVRSLLRPSVTAGLPSVREAAPPHTLSSLEQQVLQLVAIARSTPEIAEQLAIDMEAVMTVKTAAMQKAGLSNRIQLLRYAIEHGWIDEE